MLSFLDYLDNFSAENLKTIRMASDLKRRADLAKMLGISENTLKAWFMDSDKPRYRSPSPQTWNLLMYQLEARRLGYMDLKQCLEKVKEHGEGSR